MVIIIKDKRLIDSTLPKSTASRESFPLEMNESLNETN